LGDLLSLHLIYNSVAAFSIAPGRTTLLSAFSLAVLTLILWKAKDFTERRWILAAGLVSGGITGNLIDRIFRPPGALAGQVVDWIELPHWPTFNLADSSIVIGAILAAILVLREIKPLGNDDEEKSSDSDAAAGDK
jgi:signal peptidase II